MKNLSLRPIWLIAIISFKQMVRDRLLYGVLLVAALITASSFFMASVSLDQDVRVLQNIGLAAIHACTLFITVFVTTTAISREIEGRTLYLLFPKPISRGQYVLGKYLGSILLLLTSLLILGTLFGIGAATLLTPGLLGNIAISLAYSFLEISLLVAVSVLFAVFTAPLNAALYTTALFVIGHSLSTLLQFAAKNSPAAVYRLVQGAYYLLPNLEKFNVRPTLLYDLALPTTSIIATFVYWGIYVAVALFLAIQVMRMREV